MGRNPNFITGAFMLLERLTEMTTILPAPAIIIGPAEHLSELLSFYENKQLQKKLEEFHAV